MVALVVLHLRGQMRRRRAAVGAALALGALMLLAGGWWLVLVFVASGALGLSARCGRVAAAGPWRSPSE